MTTWHVTLKHFKNWWVELVVHETDRHVGFLMPELDEDVDVNESYLNFLSGSKRWTGIASWWEDLSSL